MPEGDWADLQQRVIQGGKHIIDLRGRSSFQSPAYISISMIAAAMGGKPFTYPAGVFVHNDEFKHILMAMETVITKEGKFTVTLLAEGNRLTGVGACNRLTGAYKTDGKRTLKIGPLAATMMACPGMDEEDAFTKMLESVTHYDMDGPMLLLLSDGELRAVFQARP